MNKSDLKIFLIDDEAMVIEILKEFFIGNGYSNITCFNDSQELLTAMKQEKNKNGVTVVFSDQVLQGITGGELLQKIQSILPIQGAIITGIDESIHMDEFPVFIKGSPDFFDNILNFLNRFV